MYSGHLRFELNVPFKSQESAFLLFNRSIEELVLGDHFSLLGDDHVANRGYGLVDGGDPLGDGLRLQGRAAERRDFRHPRRACCLLFE